jgi:hypothetical protein
MRDFVSGFMPIEDIERYSSIRFCRFKPNKIHTGNSIIMLLGAVLFCQMTRIKHIDGSSLVGLFGTFTTTDGITVWSNGTFPFTQGVYTASCFYVWTVRICPDINMTDVAATVRHGIISSLPRKHIPSDTVVMHIRGADVFGPPRKIPSHYWQPPCRFYTDVQRYFDHTIVYSVDFVNPCVNVTLRNGAVLGNGSAADAFASLVWAENFVLSRSSFARAALYMSAVKKNFYVFEGDPDSINSGVSMFFYRYLEHGDHWNCVASQNYRNRIVPNRFGNWSAAPDQLAFMLIDECEWTRATIADRSYSPREPVENDSGWGWSIRA